MRQETLMLDEIRILLVEDDADTRALLRDELAARGYTCVPAACVDEAIGILRTQSIDLTVLDWGLDRSGAEVLRAARELKPSMPVIVASGMPFDVRTDAVTQQADAFLQKPVSAAVVSGQVAQLLKRVRNVPAPFLPRDPREVRRLEEVKALYIRSVVELFDGNLSLAAKAMGIHRQTVSTAVKHPAEPPPGAALGTGPMPPPAAQALPPAQGSPAANWQALGI